MKFISEEVLDRFRHKTLCEWCRKGWRGKKHPHHLFKRGMGGGSRLDLPISLISLCPPCHHDAEAGVVTQFDLLAIVAQRESVLQDDIEDVVRLILRLDRDLSPERLQELAFDGLNKSAAALMRRCLKEMGKCS